jgi:hypothetical protein
MCKGAELEAFLGKNGGIESFKRLCYVGESPSYLVLIGETTRFGSVNGFKVRNCVTDV